QELAVGALARGELRVLAGRELGAGALRVGRRGLRGGQVGVGVVGAGGGVVGVVADEAALVGGRAAGTEQETEEEGARRGHGPSGGGAQACRPGPVPTYPAPALWAMVAGSCRSGTSRRESPVRLLHASLLLLLACEATPFTNTFGDDLDDTD